MNKNNTSKETYEVWRQDDNGNQFLIEKFHTEEDAQRLAKIMTDRGHKQTYWVKLAENTTVN